MTSRRQFLLGACGVSLGLPFLETLAAPCLPGAACDAPQRFVLFHNPQGTVLDHWTPQGTENSFTLPPITAPLTPFQSQCLFVGGTDNVVRDLMKVGDGHVMANRSLYTCLGFFDEAVDVSELSFSGPSFDQVLAKRLQGAAPLASLNLALSAGSSTNSFVQSPFLAHGANDPVTLTANPLEVYATFFAGASGSAAAAANLLVRRVSVLDAVSENFKLLNKKLSAADKMTMDAHATKIYALEQELIELENVKEACGIGSLASPSGYAFWEEAWEPVSVNLQMDLLVYALSCGLTRVASLDFRRDLAPVFPWLWEEFGGPLVATNVYDSWHTMVHTGRNIDGNKTPEPGLVRGYQWYAECFAKLLQKMSDVPDGDGKSLLETSLVLWGSEYGDGLGHLTTSLPFVMAGTAGPKPMGRWVDLTPTNNSPKHCVNELFVAILQAFGGSDQSFGDHLGCPEGALPGVLS